MSIRGCIRYGLLRIKGKLSYPTIMKRVQHPVALNMSMDESKIILNEACIQREGTVFDDKGATSKAEDLFDLSVIVPVYNGEKYLSECIESILQQKTDYKIELICVDDGSQDSSYQILQSYVRDPRITIIRQKNKGISSARNQGLKKARGKYIMFVDNDDMLKPGMIQILLDQAKQHGADIIKSGHIIAGRIQYRIIDSPFFIKTGKLAEELIRYNGYIWGMLIKREIFRKVNFPEGFWYEDMITRLLIYRLCNSFVYVDQPMYFHRMHGNNASAKVWSTQNVRALDQFILAKEITKYADSLNLLVDEWVYRLYLGEFGKLLYERTANLDMNIRQAVFLQCSELLRTLKLKTEVSSLQKYEYMLNLALISRDFELWECVCKYYL